MAGRVFGQEPLVSCPTAQEIHDTLYGWQCNDRPPDLNVVYVEKARLSVGPAVSRCHQEYFVRLVRWLKGCGKEKRYSRWKRERAEKRGETLRRWESVPVEMQDEVTAGDLEQLRTHASVLTFPQALDLFRAVAMEGLDAGLSPVQAKVVRAIHQSAQERHRCPAYGTDKRFTAQFHLDYRIVKGRADALNGTLADLETHARILVDEGNGCYKTFLEISNPVPYGAAIRLPMVLHAATLKRLLEKEDRPSGNGDADRPSANSIAIELGASRIQVKLCLARPDPLPDAVREAEDGASGQEKEPDWDELARRLNACDYFLGRDYGYANTVALCLIRRDREVSADDLRRIAAFDKEGALEYLTTHSHDGPEVVERFLFDGRDFMARIHLWSLKIDLLRAEVDLVYDRIRRIKALLVPVLGLRPDELIPVSAMAADHADPRTARLVKRFFHLLDAVKSLKARSLAAYAAIDGIKKSWFGFISTKEMELARKHSAAVIREDLTVMVPEKETPEYKGRTFAKMINNGAKGKYLRQASGKLRWNGVPEYAVPSFYTSVACILHSLAAKAHRRGERFRCPACGGEDHADLHAAGTIAVYLLLRPSLQNVRNASGSGALQPQGRVLEALPL